MIDFEPPSYDPPPPVPRPANEPPPPRHPVLASLGGSLALWFALMVGILIAGACLGFAIATRVAAANVVTYTCG